MSVHHWFPDATQSYPSWLKCCMYGWISISLCVMLATPITSVLAEALYAYYWILTSPCAIFICQPTQSYPYWLKCCMCMVEFPLVCWPPQSHLSWLKHCMHITESLSALALYLCVGQPNHIYLGQSAACVQLTFHQPLCYIHGLAKALYVLMSSIACCACILAFSHC